MPATDHQLWYLPGSHIAHLDWRFITLNKAAKAEISRWWYSYYWRRSDSKDNL